MSEEKRLEIIEELLQNEQKYYEDLEKLVQISQGLSQMAEDSLPSITKRAIKEVFLNVEQLQPIQKHLLDGISQRIELWAEIQLFGDIFLKMSPFLKGYSTYLEYSKRSKDSLSKLMKDQSFANAIGGLSKAAGVSDISGLLDEPAQRIQYYISVLNKLLKSTEEDNIDFENISGAISALQELVSVTPLAPIQHPSTTPTPATTSTPPVSHGSPMSSASPIDNRRASQAPPVMNQRQTLTRGSPIPTPNRGTLRSGNNAMMSGNAARAAPGAGGAPSQQGTLRSGQGTLRNQMQSGTMRSGRGGRATPVPQKQRQLIAEGVVNVKSKEDKEQSSGINKMFGFGSKTQKDLLQIWLFTDVLVHVKTDKNKKKSSTIQAIEYTWPLELIWVQDIDKLDNSDPKLAHTFRMTGPKKSYILRFPDSTEKSLWLKRFQDAISKILNIGNAPDDERRYGKYKFQGNNGEYEGWWKNGKIHGEGVYVFFGNKYTGQWEDSTKSGVGTLEFVTGEVYHGDWANNVPSGYGQLQYTNGDKYEGEWKDGQRSGLGILTYAHGDMYTGEWGNNAPHGEGTYRTATGFVYTGNFYNGKFHGHGTLLAPNGRCYEGEFRNGMKHGEGKLDYANGDFYIGQWKEDKRHGYGVFHSPVEGIYEGNYQLDKKEGYGVMQYRSGDVYEGNWKRDVYHGNGTLYCISGGMEKYEGNFEMGKMSGKGTVYYRDGSRYDGHIEDDILHGTGVYSSSNAVTFDGKWEDGRRNGKAVLQVGPSKFPSNCKNGMMAENEKSFLVNPDIPILHLEL